jgi:integrase
MLAARLPATAAAQRWLRLPSPPLVAPGRRRQELDVGRIATNRIRFGKYARDRLLVTVAMVHMEAAGGQVVQDAQSIQFVEREAQGHEPTVGINLPKVPKRLPRFLSPEERDRLLLAAKKGRDYHLLVATGVYLGLRKAEMNALG